MNCSDSGENIVFGDSARQPVAATVGDRTGVTDLGGDRGALGVHRVGEPAQARHRLVAPVQLAPLGASLGSDGAVGDGRHADAAGGDPPVELDQLVGDQSVAASCPRTSPP